MKIALVSTGLGRVRRGFESFTDSLFNAIRSQYPDLHVTLFQGGGKSGRNRVVVPNLHRADLPARWFGEMNSNHIEKRSFALALYPVLRAGHYDVVHYNELTMGSALFHLRRIFGGSFKLLYCNGAPSPPIHYHHRCDFAQILTQPDWEQAAKFGIANSRLFPIPYGIDSELFCPQQKEKRSSIRRELTVPADARLILSVAAIKSEHKRIDYLIREVSALPTDTWLLVAGQRTDETSQLETLAESLMPGRWRFITWPHERIAELYGAADHFVLASLSEAFGLVTIEALMSELPVTIHNGPIFSWLAEETSAQLIDMSLPGNLTEALSNSSQSSDTGKCAEAIRMSRATAVTRFSWQSLIPQYLEMYKSVLNAN